MKKIPDTPADQAAFSRLSKYLESIHYYDELKRIIIDEIKRKDPRK